MDFEDPPIDAAQFMSDLEVAGLLVKPGWPDAYGTTASLTALVNGADVSVSASSGTPAAPRELRSGPPLLSLDRRQ